MKPIETHENPLKPDENQGRKSTFFKMNCGPIDGWSSFFFWLANEWKSISFIYSFRLSV